LGEGGNCGTVERRTPVASYRIMLKLFWGNGRADVNWLDLPQDRIE
jgi:hypothetical protein